MTRSTAHRVDDLGLGDDVLFGGPAEERADEEESDWNPILIAAIYARAGMRVFPVDMRPGPNAKEPLHGYMWKARASADLSTVVDDFTDACQRIGMGNVGVAWALGIDRCLALDLDHDEPDWWDQVGQTAMNVTKRGVHLIFRQPPDRTIGNGVSKFPTRGWGEVRGAGGYIIIAATDRPGFDVAEMANVVAFPKPEWLTDAGPDVDPVDDTALRAFIAAHATGDERRAKGYRTRLARRASGESRHNLAVEVAPWMARQAAAGLVPARAAFGALSEWWKSVADDGDRRLGRRELDSIVRWAIGVALADPERIESLRVEGGGAGATAPAGNLPEEFWNTRPELGRIRQAAHAKARSGDAVLGAVLARISMLVPPTMRVDTGVVIPAPLNSYVGLVAQSGGGKTSAAAVARDLVPIDRNDLVVDMPLGSGEGAIEMFYEWLLEEQPDGKKAKVKRRTKTGVLLTLDEGQALSELGGRNGAVLLPVLRTAWSGETIGQTNAREETKRRLEAHTYRLSLIVGFQAAAAGTLLADQERGTAQRFVLFSTVDPTIPDTAPGWPTGDVLAEVPATAPEMLITVAAEVATEIRTRALAVARGQVDLDPLDSHRDQSRARIGGLLAILADRREVTVEDWELAGMILDTSDAVRRWVLDTNADAENQREDDRTRAAVKRQRLAAKALDDDLHGRAVLGGARAIARLAHRQAGEPITSREAARAPAGKHRQEANLEDMIDRAVDENWIRADGDGWVAGGSRPA